MQRPRSLAESHEQKGPRLPESIHRLQRRCGCVDAHTQRRLRQRWAIPLIAFGESTIESKCLIFCWQFYHKRLMIVGMIKTMPDTIREYFATIGRKGGSKSRRTLTPEQARNMLRVREARRAFRKYHTQCFWYMAKDAQIKQSDIPEIVRGLKTNGGRQGFILAAKLCR